MALWLWFNIGPYTSSDQDSHQMWNLGKIWRWGVKLQQFLYFMSKQRNLPCRHGSSVQWKLTSFTIYHQDLKADVSQPTHRSNQAAQVKIPRWVDCGYVEALSTLLKKMYKVVFHICQGQETGMNISQKNPLSFLFYGAPMHQKQFSFALN